MRIHDFNVTTVYEIHEKFLHYTIKQFSNFYRFKIDLDLQFTVLP